MKNKKPNIERVLWYHKKHKLSYEFIYPMHYSLGQNKFIIVIFFVIYKFTHDYFYFF